MTNFLPIVTTLVGSDGMNKGYQKQFPFLVRENPEMFAKGIITMYTNETYWNIYVNAIPQYLSANFGWPILIADINKAMAIADKLYEEY